MSPLCVPCTHCLFNLGIAFSARHRSKRVSAEGTITLMRYVVVLLSLQERCATERVGNFPQGYLLAVTGSDFLGDSGYRVHTHTLSLVSL